MGINVTLSTTKGVVSELTPTTGSIRVVSPLSFEAFSDEEAVSAIGIDANGILCRVSSSSSAEPTGSSIPSTLRSIGNFADNRFAETVANTMPGHVDVFRVRLVVRLDAVPSGLEVIFCVWNPFQAQGGWFVGVDNSRWKFGLGRQSDGEVQEFSTPGIGDLTYFRGGNFHRWHTLILEYDGTTATLYVDSEAVGTQTPASGYQVANAALTPRIGRTSNNGVTLSATNCHVLYWDYADASQADWEVYGADNIRQALACVEGRTVRGFTVNDEDSSYYVDQTLTDLNSVLDIANDEQDNRTPFTWGEDTESFPNVWP